MSPLNRSHLDFSYGESPQLQSGYRGSSKLAQLSLSNQYDGMFLQEAQCVPLYTAAQVQALEQAWFDAGNPSFGLMQQAAWQMAQWLRTHLPIDTNQTESTVCVWVGGGNNGGDGWLIAAYLQQFDVSVTVIEVGKASTIDSNKAKQIACQKGIGVINFSDIKATVQQSGAQQISTEIAKRLPYVSVMIDALFGIGLDRAPKGDYKLAIDSFNACFKQQGYGNQNRRNQTSSNQTSGNQQKHHQNKTELPLQNVKIALDMPSGLLADTGRVFDNTAIRADITLCLVARKQGLHIKDGKDYSGVVIDLPLIPYLNGGNNKDAAGKPSAYLQHLPHTMQSRHNDTHKGSYGTALIIGGNQVAGSQGMGGAAIAAASSAMFAGVGKLTVACATAFHGSVITSLPNAMTIDLHDKLGVQALIESADVVAVGMGLGRDDTSYELFESYLAQSLELGVDLVIDADALYHLTTLSKKNESLLQKLIDHADNHTIFYTPHSGEAARLLDTDAKMIESDRVNAIKQLADKFGGDWVLKGAGSLVNDDDKLLVCAAGNAGMATAGMGDVLSGLCVGLLAQSDLPKSQRSLMQAVTIHALAGDLLQQQMGDWALQSNQMPAAIGEVMRLLSTSYRKQSRYIPSFNSP